MKLAQHKEIEQNIKLEDDGLTQGANLQHFKGKSNQKYDQLHKGYLLKNHYQTRPNYPWMMDTGILSHYHDYYGHTADYYSAFRMYQMEKMFQFERRRYQDYLDMIKTADIGNSAFTYKADFKDYLSKYPFLSSSYQQPTKNHDYWLQNQNNENSKQLSVKIEEDEQNEQKSKRHSNKSKIRNQTKNIPKNYGKAMISFIMERSDWIKLKYGSDIHNDLIAQLRGRKNKINSIAHLKQLWTNSKYSKQFRILSHLFLRKYSFAYIFNSRVSNYSTHIKYKYKLQEALKSPETFKSIKEY